MTEEEFKKALKKLAVLADDMIEAGWQVNEVLDDLGARDPKKLEQALPMVKHNGLPPVLNLKIKRTLANL